MCLDCIIQSGCASVSVCFMECKTKRVCECVCVYVHACVRAFLSDVMSSLIVAALSELTIQLYIYIQRNEKL